jgi:cytochrome oxidase assembly protein ShyY1
VIAAEVQKHFREEANQRRSEKMLAAKVEAHRRGQTSTTIFDPAEQADDSRRTWQDVAERAKVSERKARQALAVVADAPELLPRVARGER